MPDNCLSNIKPTNSTPGSIISGLKWRPADVDVLRMWGERFLFDCCIYVCLWFMLSGAECIQAETFQILLHFCISQILEYLCIFSNIMLSLPGLAWRRMHPCWDFSDIPPGTNAQSHKANWGSFEMHLTTLKLSGIIVSRRCYNYILITVTPGRCYFHHRTYLWTLM